MIINSAMINSKDVLEMKLNNSIVYSAAPTVSYNYYFQHANTDIPSWIDKSCLFTVNSGTAGYHFQGDAAGIYGTDWFVNYPITSLVGKVTLGYLFLDLTNCTKGLKITVYSKLRIPTTGHGAGAYIYVYNNTLPNSLGTLSSARTLGSYGDSVGGVGYYNSNSVTLTQAEIATYKYFAIRMHVNSGATGGSSPEFHVKYVQFEEV